MITIQITSAAYEDKILLGKIIRFLQDVHNDTLDDIDGSIPKEATQAIKKNQEVVEAIKAAYTGTNEEPTCEIDPAELFKKSDKPEETYFASPVEKGSPEYKKAMNTLAEGSKEILVEALKEYSKKNSDSITNVKLRDDGAVYADIKLTDPLSIGYVLGTLDVDDLPWDARIHASTKTKTLDGRWKKKKGVDPAIVLRVTSELKQVMSVPSQIAPKVEVAIAPPPPPAGPPVLTMTDLSVLTMKITSLTNAKKISPEQINSIFKNAGVPGLPALISRLDLVPIISKAIDEVVQ